MTSKIKLSTKMKVLIVDDIKSIRQTVINGLSEMGFKNILEAEDGLQAFQALEDQFGDDLVKLVICDINMPLCNGIEFVTKVRGSKDYFDLPIIMLSTESETSTILSAIEAGANNYILKPFSKEILKAKLMELFYTE